MTRPCFMHEMLRVSLAARSIALLLQQCRALRLKTGFQLSLSLFRSPSLSLPLSLALLASLSSLRSRSNLSLALDCKLRPSPFACRA